MRFSIYQVSRRGARRKNEDRMGYCYTREAGLFLLADGMGGHPEGEVAAQMALTVAAQWFEREARPTVPSVPGFLKSALRAAHLGIRDYAEAKGLHDAPRTTLVAALIQDGCLHWVHCGDSRLYLLRDGAILTRTRDHSLAERLGGGTGRVVSLNRHVLYTCLGSPVEPEYDLGGPLALLPGDKMLLCSDGFWDNLGEDLLVNTLSAAPVSQSVPPLVEQALQHGGETCDNVTVLSLDWEPALRDAPSEVVTDAVHATEFASTLMTAPDAALDDPYPAPDGAIDRSHIEIEDASRPPPGRKD